MQWGKSGSLGEYSDWKFTFPVSYSEKVYALTAQQSNNQNNIEYTNSVWPKETTTTHTTLCNGSYGGTYYYAIVVGK